ncbi:MAG: phosphoribosylanthranilate isomerase [Candidatus Cyclobacteriaceae bacterium M2_1C_046]
MALKTTVKVTINNLSDARYCAGMGVDLIGFSTNPDDPFYLSPENFKEISEWLSGVEYVAETSVDNLSKQDYDVNYIQITDIALAEAYPDHRILLEGRPEEFEHLKEEIKALDNLAYLVLNIDHDKDSIPLILKSFEGIPLLLGYDLSLDEVKEHINTDIEGVALKGSDEDRPGLKDYDELADILEGLEVDAPY